MSGRRAVPNGMFTVSATIAIAVVVVVRTCPQAISLAMITMRKSFMCFLIFAIWEWGSAPVPLARRITQEFLSVRNAKGGQKEWKNALDRGLIVGVLFVDFRKAFDTVNHTILLEKLKAIGISGDLFSWLDDYMSARKQFVQLSGYQSGSKTVTYGVPQGSILGPKLFSIFVNDLPESITSGDLFMFADDTTIFTIGKNIDNIVLMLQSVLDQLYIWCQSNTGD